MYSPIFENNRIEEEFIYYFLTTYCKYKKIMFLKPRIFLMRQRGGMGLTWPYSVTIQASIAFPFGSYLKNDSSSALFVSAILNCFGNSLVTNYL